MADRGIVPASLSLKLHLIDGWEGIPVGLTTRGNKVGGNGGIL
jgi:hypothetical protein